MSLLFFPLQMCGKSQKPVRAQPTKLSIWSGFCLCLNSNSWEGIKKFSLPVCPLFHSLALVYLPPHHSSPAVFLNIGICVSAAWLVDQLGRRGGGHSKAACSMSIGPQLSFKAPGCQSASLIRPQWDQREKKKPQRLMQMCSGLVPPISRVVCAHKQSDYHDSRTHTSTRVVPQN